MTMHQAIPKKESESLLQHCKTRRVLRGMCPTPRPRRAGKGPCLKRSKASPMAWPWSPGRLRAWLWLGMCFGFVTDLAYESRPYLARHGLIPCRHLSGAEIWREGLFKSSSPCRSSLCEPWQRVGRPLWNANSNGSLPDRMRILSGLWL